MSLILRELRLSDAPQIYSLLQAANRAASVPIGPNWNLKDVEEECAHKGWVIEVRAETDKAELFREDVGGPLRGASLGGRDVPSEDRPCGAVINNLCGFILFRRGAEVDEITFLATHPDWRRSGLMVRLLKHMIASLDFGESFRSCEKDVNADVMVPDGVENISTGITKNALGSQRREIWIEVHENNHPARSLYEKLGFLQVGKRPRYYSDGGAGILYSYESKRS